MQIGFLLFLTPLVLWATPPENLLAKAYKIVPKSTNYRLLSGPENFCPDEGNILWRENPDGPYLQLTPSIGISGFDKSGWITRPDGASQPECKFEAKTEVSKTAILYDEKENCAKENWRRNLSIKVERKGEFGLVITHTRSQTKGEKKEPDIVVSCELLFKR